MDILQDEESRDESFKIQRRFRRQSSSSSRINPKLPNITLEDVASAIATAEKIIDQRFSYFQPQIYQAGEYFANLLRILHWYVQLYIFLKCSYCYFH